MGDKETKGTTMKHRGSSRTELLLLLLLLLQLLLGLLMLQERIPGK